MVVFTLRPGLRPALQRAAAAGLLVGLLIACGTPEPMRYAFEDEEEKGPWQEAQVNFPASPAASDLVPVQSEANSAFRFFVDTKSIAVGADGVVRYTAVVKSPAGASTTSYEGIRCKTFEHKTYGYQHSQNKWTPGRARDWKRIERGERNGYVEALALDYFCVSTAVAGSADEIVKRVKSQQILNPRLQY
jgi:hypothetical protein